MRSDEVSEWSQSIFNLSTEEQVFWSEQKSEYEGTVSYLCTNAHLERKYLSIVQYLKSPRIRGFIAYIKNQPTYISHSITFLWYQILLWAVPDKVGYRVYAAAHAPLRGSKPCCGILSTRGHWKPKPMWIYMLYSKQ
jgi:hypothetical protein